MAGFGKRELPLATLRDLACLQHRKNYLRALLQDSVSDSAHEGNRRCCHDPGGTDHHDYAECGLWRGYRHRNHLAPAWRYGCDKEGSRVQRYTFYFRTTGISPIKTRPRLGLARWTAHAHADCGLSNDASGNGISCVVTCHCSFCPSTTLKTTSLSLTESIYVLWYSRMFMTQSTAAFKRTSLQCGVGPR